jgi:hypothetical protein
MVFVLGEKSRKRRHAAAVKALLKAVMSVVMVCIRSKRAVNISRPRRERKAPLHWRADQRP